MNETNNIREQVERFCSRIGREPLLVQGAGGNISWKDDKRLWIKASGTRLADAGQDDIFIPLDFDHLRLAIEAGDFSVKPLVLEEVQLRPSIETYLHALMPHKLVVHLHAVEILVHLVRKDFERIFTEKLGSDISWVSVPYHKPGPGLAQAVSKVLTNRPDVNVVFLQNHGVVLGGSGINDVEGLLERLVGMLRTPIQESSGRLTDSTEFHAAVVEAGYDAIMDDAIQHLAKNPQLFDKLKEAWALYPDHVVFLGAIPNCYPDKDSLLADTNRPELVFVQGDGVYASKDFNNAKKEQLRCYYDVLVRQQDTASLSVLSNEQIVELLDWDAEKYRVKVSR